MPTVKIISNPYKKEICYQKWSDEKQDWTSIDASTAKNSKLLGDELSHGFFPFRAKQIVDAIIDEYSETGAPLKLIFEGSMDEFEELVEVCNELPESCSVTAEKSEISLENARDILPEVRALFQELSPLIQQSVSLDKIERDLSRFTDAASDVVPVCVLGNYSTGKSTFINSLIGSEILPSGIEPITAKIYKISRSKFEDRGSVRFRFKDQDVRIQFTENETLFDGEGAASSLAESIKKAVLEIEKESISNRVNKTLSIVNSFENNSEEPMVSDLIEVEIPFARGVLAQSPHPFVLFDTPGSNSASNARHLVVLKQAMANMTNGLPIFLSTPDALDSMDNENLYHIIRDMEELDNRFTMIVVNKADGPGLQRRESTDSEQKRILSQAVPRNLYSGGLFYVSSILGLGSKNNGEFLDEFYSETFDDQVYKYSNPNEKRYKTLYSYNILPGQIKKRADALAAKQSDLVYANSGLFSIETEIENFAGKYSSYNKCFQSQLFLRKVIQITEKEINDKKLQKDELRQIVTDQLEADKKLLVEKLDTTAAEERAAYDAAYVPFMNNFRDDVISTFTATELEEKVIEMTNAFEDEMDYDDRTQDVKDSLLSVPAKAKDRFLNAGDRFSLETVKKVAKGFVSDLDEATDRIAAMRETRHNVDKSAADKLLKLVSDTYKTKLDDAHSFLDSKSREYWTENTEALRSILASIVAGSDILTDERRRELEQIIITYEPIEFNDSSERDIFSKENFAWHFKLGELVLWQSDHLNFDKLARVYNRTFREGIDSRYKSIDQSHRDSAYTWIANLLNVIFENLVQYSPELSKKAKQIKILTDDIEELKQRELKLAGYTQQLCAMMDWKEV